MNAKRTMFILLGVLLISALQTLAASEQEVISLINAMPISSAAKQTVSGGFVQGINDGRLTADQAFDFLQSVSTSGAAIEDRETVLVAIAQTLLADTPVEMLINKVVEGLARGLPMNVIADEILERKQTLFEVKALLNGKGIQIQQQTNGSGYPRSAVDAAVTDVATVLEDHVRSGQNPNDGSLLSKALNTLQRDGRISDDLFNSLSASLAEADLARIAANIKGRIG